MMQSEKEIITEILTKIVSLGYVFMVTDEEDEKVVGLTSEPSMINGAVECMGEGEVEFIEVFQPHTNMYEGQIMLVYGNDGYDIVCDYSTSLDFIIESDEVQTITDKWESM